MTDKEQIEALKAQVNYLREALTNAAKAPNHTFYYAKEALEATPAQCLAEVKAKAIEDVAEAMKQEANYTYHDDYYISYLSIKADEIREQAK